MSVTATASAAARAACELAGQVARARVEVRLEDDEHAAAVDRRPRGRERRGDLARVVAVVVEHLDAGRLPAPLEPPADARGTRAARARRRRAARPPARARRAPSPRCAGCALRGRRARRKPARAPRREPDDGASASQRSKSSRTSSSEANVAWWSSSTFVTTAICGRSSSSERSDSSPSATSQPLARTGVAAELRHLAADQERRVEPEPVETERDHRRGRRLAVCAGDDDRRPERDELGEQLASPPARRGRRSPGCPVRSRSRRSPRRRRGRWRRRGRSPRERRPPRAARRTRSARGPSRRPPPPTRARRARARSCPRRRSRRTRSAYPRASAISSSAISSAASGRATRSIASPISARRRGSSSSERTISGTRPSSVSGTRIAPPASWK